MIEEKNKLSGLVGLTMEEKTKEKTTKGFQIFTESKQNKTKYYLAVGAIAVITLLVLAGTQSIWKKEERFSALYLVPGYYYYYAPGKTAHLTYGIENFEGQDAWYKVKIFLNDSVLKEDSFRVPKGEKKEKAEQFTLPSEVKLPARLAVQAETGTETYEVFFWIRE